MDNRFGVIPIIILAALFLMIGLLVAPKYITNEENSINKLYVVGKAEAKIVPDNAIININITNLATTADLALQANQKQFDAIKLLHEGLLKDYNDLKLETSYFSVSPEYQWDKNYEKSILIGYRATHNVNLTVPDFNAKKGLLINTISDIVKFDSVSISNLSFELSDTLKQTTKESLVSEAMKDAWTKAKGLGDAGYFVLNTSPKELRLNYNDYSYPIYYAKDSLAGTYESEGAANNTINPDEVTLSVSVDATYTYK